MTESQKLKQSLESILDELDNEQIDNLTEEELLEYRKKLNIYGRTIQGSDNYLNFSFTNLQEKYQEKLLMTSMIGFLNRAVDEYHVPDGLPIISVYDYTQDPSLITSFSKDWTLTDKLKKDIEDNEKWMQERVIIKKFLEEMFQYNPDKHIRSAYKPNVKDLARGLVDTPAANLAVEELKARDIKFREQMVTFDRVQKLITMKEGAIDEELQSLVSKKLVLPKRHYRGVDFENWPKEDLDLLYNAYNIIPPVDIFGKFRTYMEINYDKLREAVLHLYCDKPDYDLAINPYSWHDSIESANEFVKKHSGEVISDIITASSGMWNFFAPFAKVRESTKFYNKDTAVLEEIASQIEQDAKLGADLMKNRVKQQKKKNVEEEGPDAEYFTQWKKDNTVLKDLGAVTTGDFSPEDTPDDAVCVPVYRIADGKLERSHFFSKADEESLDASKHEQLVKMQEKGKGRAVE